MSQRNPMSDAIPHAGRGKRVAVLVAIAILVVALVGVVTNGFRGRQIKRNADAMTDVATKPLGAPPPPAAP
jgi:hypothetical protein